VSNYNTRDATSSLQRNCQCTTVAMFQVTPPLSLRREWLPAMAPRLSHCFVSFAPNLFRFLASTNCRYRRKRGKTMNTTILCYTGALSGGKTTNYPLAFRVFELGVRQRTFRFSSYLTQRFVATRSGLGLKREAPELIHRRRQVGWQ
jgi:hypothetical protein